MCRSHRTTGIHISTITSTSTLCQEVDRPYARLLADLQERGLLDSTLVIWMGEFGRTPRINGRGGRDHYPRAYSIALAGCGVSAGQVIGETDVNGENILSEKRPFLTYSQLSTTNWASTHFMKI